MNCTTADVLVDSNILIYAHDLKDTRRDAAISFLSAGLKTRNLALSVQNLAELCRVATEKMRPSTPAEDIRAAILDYLPNVRLLRYGPETVLEALRIKEKSGTHFYDALLAATMLENGINTIYTENTHDFEKIPGIKAENPFK